MMTKNSIKLIVCITILATAVFSGCISSIVTGSQIYVKEQDPNNILTLNPDDGSVISSDHGANFAGKYRQDDNKITVTWNLMGLVEFYTVDDKNLTGPEPKKYKWILSKPKRD
jgi:hypothetical protein